MLVYTVIKLGHRITYGNCEAVNTTKQSFGITWPTTILSLLIFFISSQSHHTKFTYLKYVMVLVIDNITSDSIDFLIRHILQMVYQSTSSSEYLFFSFPSGFLLVSFFIMQLQLINIIITHQLHHYQSYLISFSFESWNFWQFPFCFQVSSYFLSFFGCCECWIPRIRLSLYYERHW